MRVRFLLTLIVMVAIFLSISIPREWIIQMLIEKAPVVEKYTGEGFIEKLKDWSFYVYSQWFGKNLGQLVPIIGIIFSFPLFSREIENGTIQFLVSRKGRWHVFSRKIAVSISLLLLTIGILCILPLIYSWIAGLELDTSPLGALAVHALVGSILWYSVALFFSAAFSDQVKPLISSLALLALTTTLGLLKPLSFLNTYSYIMSTSWNATTSTSYVILSLILIALSWFVFKERDL